MKFTFRSILISFSFALYSNSASAQCVAAPSINFANPSFEGTAPAANVTPAPWTECMPGQTPDTQPGAWGVNLPPTNGSSYIGLVAEPSASWQEGAAEQLSSPFLAGTTYTFTVDLANSSSTGGGIVPGCAECEIWGGFSACDANTLLWHSGGITPYDVWQTYSVTFTPTQNFTWCMFQINSLGCSAQPYILVDNISPVLPSNVTATMQPIRNDRCSGDSTGKAVVHAVGLNPPFTYVWNTPLITSDTVLNNVPAGNYTVTVTDANTCSATASVTITQPSPLTLTPTIVPATCFAASTGSAYMSYAGGTQPMTFIWSNGPVTQNNSNLFAGLYNISVTDSAGCTATGGVNITQPTQLTVAGSVTNATCGSSNGSITVTATGATGPYTYVWNTTPAQTSVNATALAARGYVVTVTDFNSCSVSAPFTVSQPPNGMTSALSVTNVLCFGQSTGALGSATSGGSPPYVYTWSTGASSVGISNLAAGLYTVTIDDQTGCGFVLDTVITQPDSALVANISKADIKCFGLSTGSATVTATGGTGGYTYNWNTTPAQTTPAINGLAAGSYLLTVTDAHACTVTATTTITQPAALSVTESHVNVLCYGGNTGSATAAAAGGILPYAYSWNTVPVDTNNAITGLIAGSYHVLVTDSNQCTATITSVITQPASPLQVTDTLISPLCFGQVAATATSQASGGTPGAGYAYLWNTTPTQSTQTISNIPAGTYTIAVTDANGCTASDSITVAPPPTALTITTTPVNVLCFGNNTGSIAAVASGSYGSFSYLWNTAPAQTTATGSQLVAGNYSITVTDIKGCTATAADVVTQPAAPLALTTTKTDVLCYGANTGAAAVTATGGTANYNYIWSTNPQQASAAATSLVAGWYGVVVTDANGCIDTTSVTITQPAAPLAATPTIQDILCNGQTNGSISVAATGGTIAYNYQWSVAAANTSTAGNLAAGSYSMTVTDANSCTFAINNMVVTEPGALTLNTAITNVSCPHHGDGKINTTVSGAVPPYTYAWNNGETTPTDTLLNGGTYNVIVTDNNGCTITATNLLVAELPGVSLSANVTNILCFPLKDGAINIMATSTFMPLQYRWSNGAVTPDLLNIDTGLYSLTVTDAHNCVADTSLHLGNDSTFSMAASPDTVTIKLGQSVNLALTAFGGTFSTIDWSPSEALSCSDCANPVSSPIQSITYYIATTDLRGCTANASVQVTVIPTYDIFVPNAFTPNGDGNNDYFEVFGNKEAWKYFAVEVFDRWGEKMLESNDMNFKWDGEYKGKPGLMGVYVYQIHLVYLDNHTDKLFKGTVTLIR